MTTICTVVNGIGWSRFADSPWYTIHTANSAAQPSVRSSPALERDGGAGQEVEPDRGDDDAAEHGARRQASAHDATRRAASARRRGR